MHCSVYALMVPYVDYIILIISSSVLSAFYLIWKVLRTQCSHFSPTIYGLAAALRAVSPLAHAAAMDTAGCHTGF